jgi:hypothetical protein
MIVHVLWRSAAIRREPDQLTDNHDHDQHRR